MKNDPIICQAFILGAPLPVKQVTRTSKSGRGGWYAHAIPGQARLTYRTEDNGDLTLLSYETWTIAIRQVRGDKVTVLLNGDSGPTKSTNEQTSELRLQLRRSSTRHYIIPFAALELAGVSRFNFHNIELVATTPDREIVKYRKGRVSNVPIPYTVHFLGETLFKHGERYYVCGLDRNDDPERRNFYLARLPLGKQPRTVDAALKMLRPKGIPRTVTATRQGEWFLVPTAKKFKANVLRRVPIVSAAAVDQATTSTLGRALRHVANNMALDDGKVYVRGPLRDAEHGTLQLGKVWHRVMRNRADGSWGMPSADGRRVKVD